MTEQLDDSTFSKQSQLFVEWLKARGFEISPKISIHDYRAQQQGRGVIALEDIAKDEVLFHIPRSAVMAVDTIDEQKEPRVAKFFTETEEVQELDKWQKHILYMMVCGPPSKSSSSKAGSVLGFQAEFKPYFDILPKTFSTLMFWDSAEANELLQGSTVLQRIGKDDSEETYHTALKPIFEKYADFFENVDTSLEAFHRMGSLTMSYSFDVDKKVNGTEDAEETNPEEDAEEEDGSESEHEMEEVEVEVEEEDEEDQTIKAMVPLADILNAHTRLCNANLFNEPTYLEMRAVQDIPKGAQVYNTYGDIPNSDLLRRYGYVETGGNVFDLTEISIQHIIKCLRKEMDDLDYSKKDKNNGKIPDEPAGEKLLEKAMSVLASWQEQGLIGDFALDFMDEKSGNEEGEKQDNNLDEFVDDAYDIPVSGIPPFELQVFIAFMTLYFLDYFASTNRRLKIKSVFSHYLKTGPSVSDSRYKRKVSKSFAHSLVKHIVAAARNNQIFMFDESVPVWKSIFAARKKDYPQTIVDLIGNQTEAADQHEQVSLSHKDMATELLASEVRVLNSALQWVDTHATNTEPKKTKPKDKLELSISQLSKSADNVLSALRKDMEAREKEIAKQESLKKKRNGAESFGNDKKKKKRRQWDNSRFWLDIKHSTWLNFLNS